jgi:hypothetical protein
MKTTSKASVIGTPSGIKWKPKTRFAPLSKAAPRTLAEINKKLAATRERRLAIAEENCIKMTGKKNF